MNDVTQIRKMPPFPSRSLLIASANMLKFVGHSGFEALRLEWDLQDTDAGIGNGLMARATSLATYALKNPELRTPDGNYLQSEIVAKAGEIYRNGWMTNLSEKERSAFKTASANAGSMNDVSESGVAVVSTSDPLSSSATAAPTISPQSSPLKRKIFVVHGHDEGARETVARFLEKLDFEVIILHEQANRGRTVMEKIEAHGDVGFAVVLLTPDDEGRKLNGTLKFRARQNVMLELGYFIGRLGRSNVCALTRGDVELPSDFAGIVYQPMEDGWRTAVARELADAGFEINWEKASRS
ncbi:nucleotide-binding protein [Rhizobium lentis]|uniref:nucleotide-binding protein n=1 Tax=Rhizobium lentis TaxID=1138194 RepID=UPI002180C9CC|nr:nucleotide-binding protein [Rhizobium lentis]